MLSRISNRGNGRHKLPVTEYVLIKNRNASICNLCVISKMSKYKKKLWFALAIVSPSGV